MNFVFNVVVCSVCSVAADVVTQEFEIHYLGYLASDRLDSEIAATSSIPVPSKHPGHRQKRRGSLTPVSSTHSMHSEDGKATEAKVYTWKDIHVLRTWRFLLSSLPVIFMKYPWLTLILPRIVPGHTFGDILLMTVLDKVFDAVTVPVLFGATALVWGQSWNYFWEKMKEDALPLIMWSTLLSFPFHILIFAPAPIKYQTIFDTLVNVGL